MENEHDHEMNGSENTQKNSSCVKKRKMGDELLKQDDEVLEEDDEPLEEDDEPVEEDDESLDHPLQDRKIDPEILHEHIIELVLRRDLPLRFFECDQFRILMSYLCPGLDHIDADTLMGVVETLYVKEFEKIKDFLKSSVESVSLSIELWTSISSEVYVSFTAHYIDKDWVLHKKLLGFRVVPALHTSEDIYNCMTEVLVAWGIENKLYSITVDNTELNDVFVEYLKHNLNMKNALLCNGELFHNRSCAHILNLIVQDTLKWIDGSIKLIRESVKYVDCAEGGKTKFLESCRQVGISINSGLHRDVPTRWVSTYHMLESALFYQRAFLNLRLMDNNYGDCPSTEEWVKIEKIVKCLKPFKFVAAVLQKHPTSTLNFLNAWKIYKSLLEDISSEDCFMKKVVEDMKTKYDKYWSDNIQILAISMVFDPRYKLSFVQWVFNKVSVNESKEHEIFSHVKSNLSQFFQAYQNMVDVGAPLNNDDGAVGVDSDLEEFCQYLKEHNLEGGEASQLDQYLEEPRPRAWAEFDVLAYWKEAEYQYPVLARMARDILAIPFSTVLSEFAFCEDVRVIDKCQRKLLVSNGRTLACLRNWMFGIDFRAEPIDDAEELADALKDVLTIEAEGSDLSPGTCGVQ